MSCHYIKPSLNLARGNLMPDLTPEHLPQLQIHRLPGLELGEGFLYPDYAGRSVMNIPASVCRWLGVPEIGIPPLLPELTSQIGDEARHILLVLMDALSLLRLKRWLANGITPVWEQLAENGLLAPLTSITPSTTSAALTSLWTGRSAAEHGIAGFELWLKEYGVVANTILHAPISFQGDVGSLRRAGFTPEDFMKLPTLDAHLASYGVQAYAFQHSIARSGLFQMLFHNAQLVHSTLRGPPWSICARLSESRPRAELLLGLLGRG
jgi:hypothetical protein